MVIFHVNMQGNPVCGEHYSGLRMIEKPSWTISLSHSSVPLISRLSIDIHNNGDLTEDFKTCCIQILNQENNPVSVHVKHEQPDFGWEWKVWNVDVSRKILNTSKEKTGCCYISFWCLFLISWV